MRIFVLSSFSDDVFLRLLGFALSLALSHGERGQIAGSPIMVGFSTIIPSPRKRGQIAENPIIVGFSTIIPSPWKREQIAENPIIVGFSTIIPSLRGRGLGRGQNPRMRVSFFPMANLPVSFSQTTCVRLSGERSSETYLAAVVFLCFSFGGLGNAYFCVAIFFRRRFLSFTFCPLPSPLPRGEGTDCRKSDNGRFSTIIPSPRGRGLGKGKISDSVGSVVKPNKYLNPNHYVGS